MIEKKGKICYHCMEIYEEDNRKCPVCGFDISNPHTYPCTKINDALPAGSIFSNRYLIGYAFLHDYFEIIYTGLDLYTEKKVFIHEFFPSEIVSRNKTDNNSVSAISQEDKEIFQKGKELYQARFQNTNAEIPYSEHILSFQERNGTSYMIGEAYSFLSLKDMLYHKTFDQSPEEYLSILHALKNNLASLPAEEVQHYDIVPDRIFVGNSRLVILTGGKEKYQFAKSFSSKLIVPDLKYCPPELSMEKFPVSSAAEIYNFSALCYYTITSTINPKAGQYNQKTTKIHKKKLINALKTHNIPISLSEAIMAGIAENPTERSKDYSKYAVLDIYSHLPAESSFFKLNMQDKHQMKVDKKIPPFKIITAAAAIFVLCAFFCFFIYSGRAETGKSTSTPAATKKYSPSSIPTQSTTPAPTQTPTPVVTISPMPTVTPTVLPTISPTRKPTKTPIHTKKPASRPRPRITVKPTLHPNINIKPTKKPLPKPTKWVKEEQIDGIN